MAETTTRGSFSTNLGFVLAAAGSAVGLGNIWKFPYITGEYGGGAFVLVYLGCILVVGLPLMYAEMVIGNRSGTSLVGAVRKLGGGSPVASVFSTLAGGMAVLSGFLILSFYSVVAGWAIHFLAVSVGAVAGGDGAEATFGAVAGSVAWSGGWHTLFMVMTITVVALGVQNGIEVACKVLMPALFAIILGLLIYVATTGGLGQSLTFLFAPDFSKLTGDAVLEALGHSFFTLSLGMGVMVAYGSYLRDEATVVRDGLAVALLDTVLALMAGIVIFAVVFAQDKEPAAGPALVFVTLPDLFATMPGGGVVAIAFFLLLIFAAWSSAISLLEVVVSWLVDSVSVPRPVAAAGAGTAIWLLGFVCAWKSEVFDFFDDATTKVMLPVGGLLIAIIAGWLIEREDAEAGFRAWGMEALSPVWTWTIRVVTPLLVSLVLLHGFGVL